MLQSDKLSMKARCMEATKERKLRQGKAEEARILDVQLNSLWMKVWRLAVEESKKITN